MDFRQRLQAAIDEKPGYNPRMLSIKAGMSDSMLHKFLTGQTESMTIKNAEKLAVALEVDPA